MAEILRHRVPPRTPAMQSDVVLVMEMVHAMNRIIDWPIRVVYCAIAVLGHQTPLGGTFGALAHKLQLFAPRRAIVSAALRNVHWRLKAMTRPPASSLILNQHSRSASPRAATRTRGVSASSVETPRSKSTSPGTQIVCGGRACVCVWQLYLSRTAELTTL